MMSLVIDLSIFDTISLSLFSKDFFEVKKIAAKNKELLFSIDKFITEHQKAKEDIFGIAVVVGEGSFTSTRIAVTVANAWAYANKIPIISVSKKEADDIDTMKNLFNKAVLGQYISATYSGEPNIGPPSRLVCKDKLKVDN